MSTQALIAWIYRAHTYRTVYSVSEKEAVRHTAPKSWHTYEWNLVEFLVLNYVNDYAFLDIPKLYETMKQEIKK